MWAEPTERSWADTEQGPEAVQWAPLSLVLGNPDCPPSAVLAGTCLPSSRPVCPPSVTAAAELRAGSRPRTVLLPGHLGTGGADSTAAWGHEVTNTRGPELALPGESRSPPTGPPDPRLWDRRRMCCVNWCVGGVWPEQGIPERGPRAPKLQRGHRQWEWEATRVGSCLLFLFFWAGLPSWRGAFRGAPVQLVSFNWNNFL